MSEPNAKRRKVEPVEAAQAVQAVFNAKLAEDICPCGIKPCLRYFYYKILMSIRLGKCSLSQEHISYLETKKDCNLCDSCLQESNINV